MRYDRPSNWNHSKPLDMERIFTMVGRYALQWSVLILPTPYTVSQWRLKFVLQKQNSLVQFCLGGIVLIGYVLVNEEWLILIILACFATVGLWVVKNSLEVNFVCVDWWTEREGFLARELETSYGEFMIRPEIPSRDRISGA